MRYKLYSNERVERCKGLVKIAKIFKLGYLPSRENQSYLPICKSTNKPYGAQANCFEHACLNLTNRQLKNIQEYEAGYLFDIKSYDYEDTSSMEETFIYRLKRFGLIAKSCPIDFVPQKENQWKVALYFGYSRYCGDTDFHVLKQEKDGSWTGKIGWSNDVDTLPSLPEKYTAPHGTEYNLYDTYIITNPYAEKEKIKTIQRRKTMEKNFNQDAENKLPVGLLKINKLLRLGHLPKRGKEHYQAYHKHTGHKTALLANCLMHACFNLTNKQLQQFTTEDIEVLTGHIQNCHQPRTDEIKRSIFNTLRKTGLQLHRSRRKCEIKENQWLVALYFGKDPKFAKAGYLRQDYHFMLKENDGSWSEKRGFTETVNFHKKPPKKFTDKFTGFEYCLEGYYLITNPYAEKTNDDFRAAEL